ncbi:ascorbate-dependent monooxygenase [Opitutus sp. GAS368]|uniref:monooxygenase n=1 Tax=Opitutus sp. GAS368 TaxID=1882749 RepID=UPI00087AE10E|nr:ascorbate-dependent monooxygenase [Opitutus sp. GAS368]SDS18582.1 Copper type II ascorbate-dependent monooxygenase, C-terminal domain [Opitutus sp. GAS368]
MKAFVLLCCGLLVTTRGTPIPAEESPPTWSRDIAPILFSNCVECHRPGGPAPFSLQTYESAAKRAKFISRLTEARIMPPWLPSGPHGVFQGERGLSEGEIATLAKWAALSAPAGDLPSAPPVPTVENREWPLGPPDVVVRMPQPFHLSSGPGDIYRAFPISLPASAIPADVRERARIPGTDLLGVAAIDIHPGNRRVLHHAHLWADSSGQARQREIFVGAGYEAFGNPGFPAAAYLGGYVPGTTPRRLPPGIAEALPLGGDLVLQIHYSPSGKPEADQTEIGLYFSREPIKRTVEWLRLGSFNLEIPAGASAHVITDELVIPADCFVLSISPHMHFLGREVIARAIFPDGSIRDLLNIPRWNFKWQDRYNFKEPLPLPRGTKIQVRWVYDNSAANPRNPHSPPQAVHFGPNTTDEMCEFHLFVVPWSIDDYPKFGELMERKMAQKIAELTDEQRQRYGFDAAEKR